MRGVVAKRLRKGLMEELSGERKMRLFKRIYRRAKKVYKRAIG